MILQYLFFFITLQEDFNSIYFLLAVPCEKFFRKKWDWFAFGQKDDRDNKKKSLPMHIRIRKINFPGFPPLSSSQDSKQTCDITSLFGRPSSFLSPCNGSTSLGFVRNKKRKCTSSNNELLRYNQTHRQEQELISSSFVRLIYQATRY